MCYENGAVKPPISDVNVNSLPGEVAKLSIKEIQAVYAIF